MRVLIKNPKSGLYLNAASQWAAKVEAYDFHTPAFAVEICMMRRLRKVHILVDTGDPANDIFLIVDGRERAESQESTRQHKQLPPLQTGPASDINPRAEKKDPPKRPPPQR